MQHGVLGSANVQVHPRGDTFAGCPHPVPLGRLTDESFAVGGVEVAQVIPATAGPLRHGVRLTLETVTGLAPFLGAGQRRLAGAGWLEIGQVRRRERQVILDQAKVAAVVPHDRERLAPVALPTEEPVAQLVINPPLAKCLFLEPSGDFALGIRRWQAVKETGVHRRAVTGEAKRLPALRGLHHHLDRQLEFLRELQVARVVCRHRHDRPRAVASQHVIGRPDRHRLAVCRVDRKRASEHTALLLGQVGALEVTLSCRLRLVRLDGGPVLVGDKAFEQIALWREYHVRRPKQRIRPRREHGNFDVRTVYAKHHFRPLRATDPVALHLL